MEGGLPNLTLSFCIFVKYKGVIYSFVLIGFIPGNNQIWILGNELLKDAQPTLNNLKTAFIADSAMPRLYIHDKFDVLAHYENKGHPINFIKQVRNNFAQMLKANAKLPTIIIIMLGNELLEDAAFAVSQLQRMVQWLLAEIDFMIKSRIKQLPEKCITQAEPAVFLLKFLPRTTRAEEADLFKSTRRKINNMIPELTNQFNFGFINAYEINSSSALLFDAKGTKLTAPGMVRLWESISDRVREIIEDKKAKLRPTTKDAISQTQSIKGMKSLAQLLKEEKGGGDRNLASHASKGDQPSVNHNEVKREPENQARRSYNRGRYLHDTYDYSNYQYDRYHYYPRKY